MVEPLTPKSIFEEIPDVDNEDLEFMVGLFSKAVDACNGKGVPVDLRNVFSQARNLMSKMSLEERRAHHPLLISITEPSIQIFRWFPKVANILEIPVKFLPLWEYGEPDVTMAFSIDIWNGLYEHLETFPELSNRLKALKKKPTISLLDYGDERGLVCGIIGEGANLVVKGTVHPNEQVIAKKVAGIIGPNVIDSNRDIIVEEFLDWGTVESLKHHPNLVGTALGVALRKTHALGLSYGDRFDRGHVRVNFETGKVLLIDWSSASEIADKNDDIKRAVWTLKHWFGLDKNSYIEALKNLKAAYMRDPGMFP